jgi:predicted DNA-binding protein
MAETSDIEIDVPEELYERLRGAAARRSMSVEDYVRELIENIARSPE